MRKKFNNKAKASAGLLKESKGLTLVELVVAIAILGIIVSPILHAFTTSQTIENKARRLSEATDAAQNIQEVIDSVSVANFLETDESKELLGYDSKESLVDDETGFNYAVIKGLESGKSTYDAKVVFGTRSIDPVPVEDDIFEFINQMEIADYSDPDGTFAQPYISSANPDDIAETYFKTFTNNKAYTQKTRDIIIDVIKDTSDSESAPEIYVNVTYHYEFTYFIQETNEAGIGTGTYRPDVYEKDIVYSAIPAGAPLHSDGSPLSCYVMYYPQYGTVAKPAKDIITINNFEDIPIKLLVVKQWTMVYIAEGDKYEEMGETALYNLETNYLCEIKENHSSTYDLEGNDQKMTYTNARINLATYGNTNEEISGVSFKVYSDSQERTRTGLIRDGGIITTSKKNRLYDVAIYLYQEGQLEDGNPIAKFKAAKAD